MCSLSEEIDFQGLMEYIEVNLLNDVSNGIFKQNKKERETAKKYIIDRAVEFSKAEAKEARQRVTRIIDISLNIIRDFYKREITKKDMLISSEIVDALSDEINASEQRIMRQIHQSGDSLSKKIDDIRPKVETQLSDEEFLNLVKQGNYSDVKDWLKLIETAISLGHPLAPDYGFNLKMKSQPLTDEAIIKYPPKFECKGVIRMGEEIVHEITPEIVNYADRHQLHITLEVKEAKKLLGNIEDPIQEEAEQLVGHTLLIREPKAFPPAFPCSISMNGKLIYEYILLRTDEILDDGAYVISNKEQKNSKIEVKLTFYLGDHSKPISYLMNMKKGLSNRECLKFIKMMKDASIGGELKIHILGQDHDLLAGYTDPFDYKTTFTNADEEIDFYSRICDIEDYCKSQIALPEEINNHEYLQVLYASEMIRGGENIFYWSSQTFLGHVTQSLRDEIAKMDDNFHELCFAAMSTMSIFNVNIEIPIIRIYKEAKIKELDKFKKKLEYAEDNETISITYIAGNDNKIVDKMQPDNFQINGLLKK